MSPRRCPAPGCGRFIATGVTYCARHAPAQLTDDDVLAREIHALRYVLGRLVREIDDIDVLATYIPRVSSVAIQATRARHQIGERGRDDLMVFLGPILEELDEGEAIPQPGTQVTPSFKASPYCRPAGPKPLRHSERSDES